jgi:hypothetical protein
MFVGRFVAKNAGMVQRVFAQVYENLRQWSLPLPASG